MDMNFPRMKKGRLKCMIKLGTWSSKIMKLINSMFKRSIWSLRIEVLNTNTGPLKMSITRRNFQCLLRQNQRIYLKNNLRFLSSKSFIIKISKKYPKKMLIMN